MGEGPPQRTGMPAVGGPGRQQPPCSTEQESLAPGEEGRATGASTHCHAGGSASLHGGHVRVNLTARRGHRGRRASTPPGPSAAWAGGTFTHSQRGLLGVLPCVAGGTTRGSVVAFVGPLPYRIPGGGRQAEADTVAGARGGLSWLTQCVL